MDKSIILTSLLISTSVFANEILSVDKSVSINIDYEGDMIVKSQLLLEPDTLTDPYFINVDMRTFPLECDGKKHESLGGKFNEAGDSYLILMSDHCIKGATKSLKITINDEVKEFIL